MPTNDTRMLEPASAVPSYELWSIMIAILTISIELILISLKLAVLAIRRAAQLLCIPFPFLLSLARLFLWTLVCHMPWLLGLSPRTTVSICLLMKAIYNDQSIPQSTAPARISVPLTSEALGFML